MGGDRCFCKLGMFCFRLSLHEFFVCDTLVRKDMRHVYSCRKMGDINIGGIIIDFH